VLFARFVLWPQSPLQLDLLNLNLKDEGQIKDTKPWPHGTYAITTLRVRNTGVENSAIDWTATVKLTDGTIYAATADILAQAPMKYDFHKDGSIYRGTFLPSDNLIYKAKNIPEGSWVTGFLIFFFQGLPRTTVNVPGTPF